jgi:4-aminobutyrate aminotransferase-like enzyme
MLLFRRNRFVGVLKHTGRLFEIFRTGLDQLKETGLITKVRGEGLVFGIECGPAGKHSAADVAVAIVKRCYLGQAKGDGIHLLGALAEKVLRVSPPMTMTEAEANASLKLFHELIADVAQSLGHAPVNQTA